MEKRSIPREEREIIRQELEALLRKEELPTAGCFVYGKTLPAKLRRKADSRQVRRDWFYETTHAYVLVKYDYDKKKDAFYGYRYRVFAKSVFKPEDVAHLVR